MSESYPEMSKESILLYGAAGTGKTASVISLLKLLPKFPNMKLRFLSIENNCLPGIQYGLKLHNITPNPGEISFHVCKADKKESSKEVRVNYQTNFLSLDGASAAKVDAGVNRVAKGSFLPVLKGLENFKGVDYATKEVTDYGDCRDWDSNCILIVDSLTALVDYLVLECLGNRIPTIISDYKSVQTNLMRMVVLPFSQRLQSECSVVFIGHPVIADDGTVRQPKKKLNEDSDRITKIYPVTYGQNLNETFAGKFGETIYCYQEGTKYFWAGLKPGILTSVRKFEEKDKLPPDFSECETLFVPYT